jgi:putative NADPH-quinone reductase
MSTEERRDYHTPGRNEEPIRRHLDDLLWCDTLVFVYPTWWYGLPAMLKGWLDRVFVPHATFEMPEPGRPIRSKLTHIEKLAVVTTGGSPWWFAELVIGNPGRRTLVRGMRALCAPGCKTLFVCHYQMDSSTPESRAKFLRQVGTKIAKFAR